MGFVYSVWQGTEVARNFDSLGSVMKFAEEAVHRDTIVELDMMYCAITWIEYKANDNSNIEQAEQQGWVRTNVTLIKESEDEMEIISRFFAMVLPRPSWDCGYYEIAQSVSVKETK